MTSLLGEPVTILSLAIALGGLLFVLHGWRRTRETGKTGERIELVTSRYLGGKKVLTLVDVEGERLLLAVSGEGVRLVARLPSRERGLGQADVVEDDSRTREIDIRAGGGEGAP